MRSIETERAGADAGALHKALIALADDGFGIGGPSGERKEALVHDEGRRWAWTAILVGRVHDEGGIEIEVLAGEQAGKAMGDDLVAQSFKAAEILPAVAPVGFEPGGWPDAPELCDVIEDRSDEGEHGVERPEPYGGSPSSFSALIASMVMRGSLTPAMDPADLDGCFPACFRRRRLKSFGMVLGVLRTRRLSFRRNRHGWAWRATPAIRALHERDATG